MSVILREPQFDANAEFLREVRNYFETECKDKTPCNFEQAESLYYLFSTVQKELRAFLRRYLYAKFWIRATDIRVSINPGRVEGYKAKSYREPVMRIELSNLSFVFDSGPVSSRILQDFATTKKFDMDTFLNGYFLDSFDGHPLRDFLRNSTYLAETADICEDGCRYFLGSDVIDSMKEEIAKYDIIEVEKPDYSLSPFDLLEMDY